MPTLTTPAPEHLAVYIGAGADPNYLNNVSFDRMIAIDSQPMSEYGDSVDPNGYRVSFMPRVISQYADHQFILTHLDNERYTFVRGRQTVHYYASRSFPDPELDDVLRDYTTLIVSGYMPHKHILSLTRHPIHFIGTSSTVYLSRDECVLSLNDRVDWELKQDPTPVDRWSIYETFWGDDEKYEQWYHEPQEVDSIESIRDYMMRFNDSSDNDDSSISSDSDDSDDSGYRTRRCI